MMDFDYVEMRSFLEKATDRVFQYLSETPPPSLSTDTSISPVITTNTTAATRSSLLVTSAPSPRYYHAVNGSINYAQAEMKNMCISKREPAPPTAVYKSTAMNGRLNGEQNDQDSSSVSTDKSVVFDKLLDELFDELLNPHLRGNESNLAYIPTGGLFASVIANFIASAINPYVGAWMHAPLLVQIESNVILWLCNIMNYPPNAFGVLTGGGSASNTMGVFLARRSIFADESDFPKGTVYLSSQTHGSMSRACMLSGVLSKNIKVIPTVSTGGQMCPVALRKQIHEDQANGLLPFLIVGTAGTTNCGEVDFLEELAAIAKEEKLWFHIDGAYGGLFNMTKRGAEALRGVHLADSIAVDPHKTLSISLGTGAFLVRDRNKLKSAFALDTFGGQAYLADREKLNLDAQNECVDFMQLSMETTREFRGLRLWLPIKMYGIHAFISMLDEKLDLAQWMYGQLKNVPGIETACPALSLLYFRYNPLLLKTEEEGHDDVCDDAQLGDINKRLLANINARNRVFLSGTIFKSKYVIRICILKYNTHLQQLQECLEDIKIELSKLSVL